MRGQMSRHCGRNWLSGICMAFLCILLMQGNAHAAGRTGDFTVKGGSYGTDYSYADHVLTVLTDTPLTISGESVSDSIQVKKDIEASVTLDNVIIRSRNCPLDIQNATVTLKFKGDVSLKGGIKQPGIAVGKDGKLSLSGGKNDTLTASGGSRAAGIGSKSGEACGSITFQGGTVYANGGMKGAGVGSSEEQSCGELFFEGGRVVAQGGSQAADIGAAQENGECAGMTLNGSCVLYADDILQDLSFERGILASNNNLECMGRQSLAYPLNVEKAQTLFVSEGSELTIPASMECTNEGTIYIYGKLIVDGQLNNEGEIVDYSGLLSDVSGITGNNVTEGDMWKIQMSNGSVIFSTSGYEQNGMTFEIPRGSKKAFHIYGNGSAQDAGIEVEKGVTVSLIMDNVDLRPSGEQYALSLKQNSKTTISLRGDNRFRKGSNALTGSILTERSASLEVEGTGTLTLESDNGSKIIWKGSGQISVQDEDDDTEEGEDGEGGEENEDDEDAWDEDELEDGDVALSLTSGDTVYLEEAGLDDIGYGDKLRISVSPKDNVMEATLERSVLERLADRGSSFEFSGTGRIDMELDTKAVEDLLSATNGNVTLSVKPFTLTEQFVNAKAAIESRPVFDIQVYDQGYREKRLKSVQFSEGRAVVSMPYRSVRGESVTNLCLVYVGADNTVEWLTGSYYDVENQTVISRVQHFSVYGVGYRPPAADAAANANGTANGATGTTGSNAAGNNGNTTTGNNGTGATNTATGNNANGT